MALKICQKFLKLGRAGGGGDDGQRVTKNWEYKQVDWERGQSNLEGTGEKGTTRKKQAKKGLQTQNDKKQ